jgi:hypothetical protein
MKRLNRLAAPRHGGRRLPCGGRSGLWRPAIWPGALDRDRRRLGAVAVFDQHARQPRRRAASTLGEVVTRLLRRVDAAQLDSGGCLSGVG